MGTAGRRAEYFGRDVYEPGLAGCFRQEPATAGPGLSITTNTARRGNPMGTPTTADAQVNASAGLEIRAEALQAAHTHAIEQCAQQHTSENLRNAATVGRTLAEVYRELAGEFCESAALFHAFCRARDHLIAEAQEYDAWADERQAHVTARGDAP